MGLMDRWRKKKTQEQLEKKEEKIVAPQSASAQEKQETTPVEQAVVKGAAYHILVKPLVTEKSAVLQQTSNQFAFVVARSATKNQIKQAIKERYGIDPIAVNVLNTEGRRIRFGRTLGRRSDYKKAVITLPAGKSITMHEGV